MRKIIRKRKRRKNSLHGWLIWFALTASFSMVGVGVAAWQGEHDIGGELGTAHIGVGFTDYYGGNVESAPSGDWDDSDTSAIIYEESAKVLKIEINNAYPGFEVDFYYEIENTGSLPVKITKHEVTSSCRDVIVSNKLSAITIDVADLVSGDINIKVNDVEPESFYTFKVDIAVEPDM